MVLAVNLPSNAKTVDERNCWLEISTWKWVVGIRPKSLRQWLQNVGGSLKAQLIVEKTRNHAFGP